VITVPGWKSHLTTQEKLERLLKLEAKLRENYPNKFKPKEPTND